MATELPLKQMSVREKLAAMEAIWEDLSRTPGAIQSPEWHNEVLEGRQKRVAEGKARYADWETAKSKIRRKVVRECDEGGRARVGRRPTAGNDRDPSTGSG